MPPDVVVARRADAPALLAMREQIARWLQDRGIQQWLPGEFPSRRLLAWIDDESVHVLHEGDRPVAAVAVVWEDPEVWGVDDGRAGYVHLLMVDRARAGQGLGDRMVDHAESHIRDHGRDLARLDVVASNRRLVQWYRARGYVPGEVRSFPGTDWFDAILLEKSLTATTTPTG